MAPYRLTPALPPCRLLLRPSPTHKFKGLVLALSPDGVDALHRHARHRRDKCMYLLRHLIERSLPTAVG